MYKAWTECTPLSGMNPRGNVAIFWDYENCPVPSSAAGYTVVNNIRSLAYPYGAVRSFRAYFEVGEQQCIPRILGLRSELQSSGVSLIDCPHTGRKDVADKMMIVDMLVHAMDNPAPATLVLISGDRDFAYALSILRLRQYRIILVTLPNAHPTLTAQATVTFNWNRDVLSSLDVAQSASLHRKTASANSQNEPNNARCFISPNGGAIVRDEIPDLTTYLRNRIDDVPQSSPTHCRPGPLGRRESPRGSFGPLPARTPPPNIHGLPLSSPFKLHEPFQTPRPTPASGSDHTRTDIGVFEGGSKRVEQARPRPLDAASSVQLVEEETHLVPSSPRLIPATPEVELVVVHADPVPRTDSLHKWNKMGLMLFLKYIKPL